VRRLAPHEWRGRVRSQSPLVLSLVLSALDFSHKTLVEVHCHIRLTKHVFILSQARVKLSQSVRGELGVLVFFVQHERLLIVESFLNKFLLSLRLGKIARHLICPFVAAADVVVTQGVIKLAVVD